MAAFVVIQRTSWRAFSLGNKLERQRHICPLVKLYSTSSIKHSLKRSKHLVSTNLMNGLPMHRHRIGIIATQLQLSSARWNSTGDTATEIGSASGLDSISDNTTSVATTAQDILQPVGEVPFTELGLGGYSPIGLLQSGLEFLHVSAGLPWWASIIVGTIVVRTLVFPLVLRNQKYTIRLNNCMPTFQRLSKEMNDAKASGDQFEMTRKSMELQSFMKKNDVNPLKSFAGILIQAPIFVSFFIGLRRMATLPVESMQTGGLWWFTDLTTSDPYYALPVLASLSMFAVMELGGEAGVSNAQAQRMKTVLRIMPFAILPLIASLPKAIFCYWLTSNTFSLCQVALLKVPAIRTALNIPEKIKHDPKDLPKQEGFFKGIKSGFKNAQTNHDVEQKQKLHLKKLKEAGTGPVPQTYSFDPTRPQSSSAHQAAPARNVRKKMR